MTVAELIEALMQFPATSPVVIAIEDGGDDWGVVRSCRIENMARTPNVTLARVDGDRLIRLRDAFGREVPDDGAFHTLSAHEDVPAEVVTVVRLD